MLKNVLVCLVVLVGCGKKQDEEGAESRAADKPAAAAEATDTPPPLPLAATDTATADTATAKPAATRPADLPRASAPGTAEVLAKFDAACSGGYGPACFDAGMRRAKGMGTAKDRVAATTWLEKGCQLDDAESCSLLAGFVATGDEGVTKDRPRAVELHRKACPRVATSCRLLAQYYGLGEVVPQDVAKAKALLDEGCKAGDKQACTQAVQDRANGADQ